MPLSPSEVQEKRTIRYAEGIRSLCEAIDEDMLAKFDGEKYVTLASGVATSGDAIAEAVEKAIFEAYEAKGWSVKRVPGSGESVWWEFTPAATVTSSSFDR